jgi:putative phosphoribosyl transferase
MFHDRKEAGILLAQRILNNFKIDSKQTVVVGLLRGGLPVAAEVARALGATLDFLLVRKIGLPFNEEVALGAVSEDETLFIDEEFLNSYYVPRNKLERMVAREKNMNAQRKKIYREAYPECNLDSKTVVIVDDGLATGATMFAAIESIKKKSPEMLIAAVPVAPLSGYNKLLKYAERRVVCLHVPIHFISVSLWYRYFPQVSDGDIKVISEIHILTHRSFHINNTFNRFNFLMNVF